ncbi:MAG: hypothetical protein U0793_31355 [Gemmataceae bacterium]
MSCRLLALFLWLLAASAEACNAPVFRYALERWNKRDADELYSLYVFHGQPPLDEKQRRDLDALQDKLEDAKSAVNLLVYSVNTTKPINDPAIAAVYAEHSARYGDKAPFFALMFPKVWGIKRALAVGPYDGAVVQAWLQSPLRQEIGRRLLQGDSGVFLFLESGVRADDEEKLALVESRLRALEKEITLPARTDAAKDKLLREDIPLKIAFSVLRLSRADKVESRLIQMLLAMDRDGGLPAEKQPVLIPIYGRGIAMVNECLIGKGINEKNVESLARFVTGPCSCEVRRQNPGIEILSDVDWDGPPPAEPETRSGVPAVRVTENMTENAPAGGASNVWRYLLWVLGGTAGGVAVATLFILVRRKQGV